jgi:ribose transport system ATP-binding protein
VFRRYASRFGLNVKSHEKVGRIRPSDRALLAIIRALRSLDEGKAGERSQLLILDEPTTYLPADEKTRLAEIMRSLANAGIGILLVSHELDYVLNAADTVTVLRDGRVVTSGPAEQMDKDGVVRQMIGRSLLRFYPERRTRAQGEQLMQLHELSGRRLQPFSMSVHAGEICGVTGLAGGGHEELPYLIHAGMRHQRSGSVRLSDGAVTSARGVTSPVAIVPASRDSEGMWAEGTASENLTIASLGMHTRNGFLSAKSERRSAAARMVDFGVRPPVPDKPMHQFSGGNQQKIVLARWLASSVRVFVLHEPVQGIDVAANADIFELIVQAADSGAGVVICSNEWDQLVHLCDRVVALREGRIVTELSGDALTEENLASACQGESHVSPFPPRESAHAG